jgi:hypothetical protein
MEPPLDAVAMTIERDQALARIVILLSRKASTPEKRHALVLS